MAKKGTTGIGPKGLGYVGGKKSRPGGGTGNVRNLIKGGTVGSKIGAK